jgi:hypothetical protein
MLRDRYAQQATSRWHPVGSFQGGRRRLVSGIDANPHVTKDSEMATNGIPNAASTPAGMANTCATDVRT